MISLPIALFNIAVNGIVQTTATTTIVALTIARTTLLLALQLVAVSVVLFSSLSLSLSFGAAAAERRQLNNLPLKLNTLLMQLARLSHL